jgi:hypothetical protein
MNVANSKLPLCMLWLFLSLLSNSAYPPDHASWPTEILNWGETPWHSAPVDLSFLNLPVLRISRE